jgi:hypothetical protein
MGIWTFFSIADLGDVGFLAHVGGFVFGVGFAFLVDSLRIEERFIEPVHDRVETVHDSAKVERLVEDARRGRIEQAMAGLEALLAGRVDSSTPEGLLIRLARLSRRLNVPTPFAALALEGPDLSPDLRDELETW